VLAVPKYGECTSDGMLNVDFYIGLELGLISLKEYQRLRVFRNRAAKKIFGSMREEVTRGCRKLYSEERRGLYCSRNVSHSFRSVSCHKATAASEGSSPQSEI
jgi:hypothetical protein